MINEIKKQNSFSFLLNGVASDDIPCTTTVEENDNCIKTTYIYENGLRVTNVLRFYPEFDACDWVNEWENKGKTESGIISELWDSAINLSFPSCVKKTTGMAYLPMSENVVKVYSPRGAERSGEEFYCDVDELRSDLYSHWLDKIGEKKRYATVGGRSSDSVSAPFFNIKHGKDDFGYIVAVGWTGQWNAEIERLETGVRFKSKIEDTHFRILPGESFRTSSVTLMRYNGSVQDGQNLWRRLIKEVYSPIKDPEKELNFSAGLWGGMSSKGCLDRIDAVEKAQLPFNCYWMDAGWYGDGVLISPDEYEGDWWQYTGNWDVNRTRHPDGLLDVSNAIRKSGKRFLLWFEPERVRRNTPIAREHPEYLIFPSDENNMDTLLNLGDDKAWQYCFDTISELIKCLNVSIYRQDFNFLPLPYWRKNDLDDRRGITEIKHINGLYRFWDKLREKYPYLVIDNCASGGRRIDIESLRRAVPLWRSDAQCPAIIDADITQAHALSYGSWMPYSGTGVGRKLFDTYVFRSAYAPALTTNYTFSEKDRFGDDPNAIEWIRRMSEEYLRVRPYLVHDIYQIGRAHV